MYWGVDGVWKERLRGVWLRSRRAVREAFLVVERSRL